MSTAFYPQGMNSNKNHLPQGGYKSWKGTGSLSNPVGIVSGHIRPLTNNDAGNYFQTGFGLPRPIKHYRKGRVIPILIQDPNNPNNYIEIQSNKLNINRSVKSSTGSSLGGGGGGNGLLNQIITQPGSYIVKQNPLNEIDETLQLNLDCNTCKGVGVVVSYYPNNTYITENPIANTQNSKLCCNQEKKALLRVRPASTILKKNYYTTLQQYRENRCQTYKQKVFNFQSNNPVDVIKSLTEGNPFVTDAQILAAKPGSPLSFLNTYFANCQPNGEIYEVTEIALINKFLSILVNNGIITESEAVTIASSVTNLKQLFDYVKSLNNPSVNTLFNNFLINPYFGIPLAGPSNQLGCKLTVYKPNNYQFAKQGSVDSSTRILKLNVDTIQTNLNSFTKNQAGEKLTANDVYAGNDVQIPFILKNKSSPCGNPPIIRFQNKKTCKNLGAKYSLSTGSYQSAFPSNSYGQSPRYALM